MLFLSFIYQIILKKYIYYQYYQYLQKLLWKLTPEFIFSSLVYKQDSLIDIESCLR